MAITEINSYVVKFVTMASLTEKPYSTTIARVSTLPKAAEEVKEHLIETLNAIVKNEYLPKSVHEAAYNKIEDLVDDEITLTITEDGVVHFNGECTVGSYYQITPSELF